MKIKIFSSFVKKSCSGMTVTNERWSGGNKKKGKSFLKSMFFLLRFNVIFHLDGSVAGTTNTVVLANEEQQVCCFGTQQNKMGTAKRMPSA